MTEPKGPAADPDFAYLTTHGRRSGRSHTVELWYRRIGDTVWFLAGQRSDWVANLLADPDAQVRIGDGPTQGGTGRVETGDEGGAGDARRRMAARYQDWVEGEALSTWASTATAVAVDLARS